MPMVEKDLSLKDLDNFYSTEKYYNIFGVNVTDGVKYAMDNGYSWAVTDAVAIIKMQQAVRKEEFVAIELKLISNGGAMIVYTDGNRNILYEQEYKITDAQKEIKFYYTKAGSVICLPMEY